MKYGSKTYGSKKYCSVSRQIRSAYGAPRLSCGCRQQHRRLRGSGAVPGLRASPPWPAWQALQALEAVILGRDDLATTNREASADSTPRTRAARVDNAASASTIMRASTITAMSNVSPYAARIAKRYQHLRPSPGRDEIPPSRSSEGTSS